MDRFLNRRSALLILFAAIACLIALADRTPLHYDKYLPHPKVEEDFNYFWRGVTDQTLPGPSVYRVLVPYLILALQLTTPLNPITIDLILKIALLVACQLVFFEYLSSFIARPASLTGVLLLDCAIAFALAYIMGPSTVETSALLDVVVFTLALMAISTNRFLILCVVLGIGMLNRETPFLLLPILFLNDRSGNRGWLRSAVVLLVVALPYFGLRLFIETSGEPIWVTFYGIKYNVPFVSSQYLSSAIAANVHVGLMLAPLIIIGLYRFREHPFFLRIASYVAPLYIVFMYTFGTIIEARLWLPLLVLLIPLAVDSLQMLLSRD